jgi:hypothetical protein
MTDTAGKPFDPIAALAFFFGAVVIVASLSSLLFTVVTLIHLMF